MRTSLTPTCGESGDEIVAVFISRRYQMYRTTRICQQRLRVRNKLQLHRFFFDIQFIVGRESQGQIFPSKLFFICFSVGFWDLIRFFLQFFFLFLLVTSANKKTLASLRHQRHTQRRPQAKMRAPFVFCTFFPMLSAVFRTPCLRARLNACLESAFQNFDCTYSNGL